MARISSFSSNTTLVNQMLRTQLDVFNLQAQVGSQKKSQDYAGISLDSQRLVNLENTRNLLKRYENNNAQQEVRLNIQSTALEGMRKIILEFKRDVSTYETGATKDEKRVNTVQSSAFRALKSLEDLMNTDVDGRFLFAGGKVTTEPVDFNVSSLASFQSTFNGASNAIPTTRTAALERFSFNKDVNNVNSQHVDASNFLVFQRDNDGNTATGGNSSITATSALFSNLTAGATVTVSGSGSNNGTYTVSSVTNNGRTVLINTEMLTDAAAASIGSIKYRDPNDPNKEITLTGGNFGNVSFTRATDTITASTASSLSGIPVGWKL